MITTLIFDFDGLILETEGPVYQSWLELYQQHGCAIQMSTWAEIIGTSNHFDLFEELERQCGRKLEREPLLKLRWAREHEMVLAQPILPGVLDYLEEARRRKLKTAVASSSSRTWVSGHLSRLGILHYFDVIKTKEDVSSTKPAPDLFLAAMADLGTKPREGLVLEDSPNGILAAKRAGLYCVAIPNDLTRSLPLDLADLQLDSLAAMPLGELLEHFSR